MSDQEILEGIPKGKYYMRMGPDSKLITDFVQGRECYLKNSHPEHFMDAEWACDYAEKQIKEGNIPVPCPIQGCQNTITKQCDNDHELELIPFKRLSQLSANHGNSDDFIIDNFIGDIPSPLRESAPTIANEQMIFLQKELERMKKQNEQLYENYHKLAQENKELKQGQKRKRKDGGDPLKKEWNILHFNTSRRVKYLTTRHNSMSEQTRKSLKGKELEAVIKHTNETLDFILSARTPQQQEEMKKYTEECLQKNVKKQKCTDSADEKQTSN